MTIPVETGLCIASHNMCRGGRADAGNAWQRLMSDVGADIVCAQETRHPSLYLASDGGWPEPVHRLVPHGQLGSAILSRRHSLTELPIADEYVGWVVGARVHGIYLGGRVQDADVYSVHIPSPGPYERRVRQFLDVLGRAPSNCARIVAGDFTVTVALRQPAEELKNTEGERLILQRFQDELGLKNAWQALHPGEPLPQTLRWSRNKVVRYHCDGIFVDSRCREHLRKAEVLSNESWTALSDHNPLVAVFE